MIGGRWSVIGKPYSVSRIPFFVHCLLFTVYCLLLIGCTTAVSATPTSLAGVSARPDPTPTLAIEPTATPLPAVTSLIATEPISTVIPTNTATPAVTPTATPVVDSGWVPVREGLARRTLRLFGDNGRVVEEIMVVRLEPAHFRWRIAYRPGDPLTLPQWQAETGALLVVNGGYFTSAYTATGLVVVDGQADGVSYGDFAGMLAITEAGPALRWLRERPYDPDEPLQYALQSFPLLVRPGGAVGFPDEDGLRARRTVVAQDRDGRFLFLVASRGHFTLHTLSRFLVESDLNVAVALNLDGGPSSGMMLADEVAVPSITAVPLVIVVGAR